MKQVFYIFLFLSFRFSGFAHAVSEKWLTQLAEFESSSGKFLVGDGGRSRGWYHMSKAAWDDVTKARRRAGLPIADWKSGTRSKAWCDVYAIDHANCLARSLSSELGSSSEQLIYAAWNAGLQAVIDAKGDLQRLPRATRRRAILIAAN
jgi:hypothetical protein